MRHRLEFPRSTRHEDLRIPVRDGVLLYARLWRPADGEPVPALLEYSPERLTDVTAARDWQRHPWYAGHGYASVRVDARGHGNSEGLPSPPWDPGPLADAVDVIEWLAAQPWCTGRIGMLGLGRAGGRALQVAALDPEPLEAVVTVCAGADPYEDDGCHLGGAVLGEGLHGQSAALLSSDCLPPDPAHAGPSWRESWLARLEAVGPAAHGWLAHQLRDDFWDRQTPGPAPRAAVLAVAGWRDPSCDGVLRLLERSAPGRVHGLIGPWACQYPDHGRPGPAIGFLQETRRWFDHWLKDIHTVNERAEGEGAGGPPLRTWSPEEESDRAGLQRSHGRWTSEPSWPSPQITTGVYELRGEPRTVDSPQWAGADAGPWRTGTEGSLAPLDQRAEDAYAACFEFPVTGEPLVILGRALAVLRLRLDVPHGQAVVRLCDVAPDGSSALVTRGVLHLAARHGPERAHAWPAGATEDVRVELAAAAQSFPPGHRIRLAVSSAYWPWIWPQSGSAGFVLDPEGSRLELPVREAGSGPPGPASKRILFADPEQYEPLGVGSPRTLEEPVPERLEIRDAVGGSRRLETAPGPLGTRVFPDGLELTEETRETRAIQGDDPQSARARTVRTVRLHRPADGWDVRIETRSEISCDADDFVVRDEAVCRDGREIVFHRTWERRIPRLAG